jgi:hypothetical protein
VVVVSPSVIPSVDGVCSDVDSFDDSSVVVCPSVVDSFVVVVVIVCPVLSVVSSVFVLVWFLPDYVTEKLMVGFYYDAVGLPVSVPFAIENWTEKYFQSSKLCTFIYRLSGVAGTIGLLRYSHRLTRS